MKYSCCLLAFLLLLGGFASCGKGLSAEVQAAAAAEKYYQALYDNHTGDFLKGCAGADSMPAAYCEELLACYERHLTKVNGQHQGVSSVHATRVQMDETLQVMQVYLLLCFGDSTQEEIVVPMVKQDEEWKMK